MTRTPLDTPKGIKTILHMSPAVSVAAIIAAQETGRTLSEFLDHAIASAAQATGGNTEVPWDLAAADLFCAVANSSPEVLVGNWSLLFERVLLERSLWHHPTIDDETVSSGEWADRPYISAKRLRDAWPRLVAAIFLC